MIKKISLIMLISFSLLSCNNSILDVELEEELKEILNTEKLELIESKNSYQINVISNNMKTELGMDMASGMALLSLYEKVTEKKDLVNYNTEFKVEFNNSNFFRTNSLEELSEIISIQKELEKVIISLLNGESQSNIAGSNCLSDLNDVDKSSVEWSKVEFIGVSGFQKSENLVCKTIESTILFRTFIQPTMEQIWFYVDSNTKKVVYISKAENEISIDLD